MYMGISLPADWISSPAFFTNPFFVHVDYHTYIISNESLVPTSKSQAVKKGYQRPTSSLQAGVFQPIKKKSRPSETNGKRIRYHVGQ